MATRRRRSNRDRTLPSWIATAANAFGPEYELLISRASGTGTAALIQLKPINPTSTPAAPGKCWSWLPQVAMLYTMFGSRMDVLNEPAIFAPI